MAMKTAIAVILWGCLGAADAADLARVQKVYVFPMLGGLDQYLAERLASQGVFTIVLDPKQADAVWTERVDPQLGETLNEIYAPPKPASQKKEDAAKAEPSEPAGKRSFGRSRGNIFLIDVASRQVVWSTYRKLEDTSPRGLHQAADYIVKQIKKDLKKE